MNFLKEALKSSASASEHFALFWNDYTDDANASQLQSSLSLALDALQESLTHLERYFFERKMNRPIQSLLRQGHHCLESLKTEEFRSSQSLSSEHLIQLHAYFDLLRKLRKQLNQLVIHEIDYFSEQQTWRQLKKIHPDFFIKLYDALFFPFFLLRKQLPFIFLIAILIVVGNISIRIHSLFSPYRVLGRIQVNPDEKVSDQIYFPFRGNGEFQQVTVPLSAVSKIQRIAIMIEMRLGHTLEIDRIHFLGKNEVILKEFDFQTSQKQGWGVFQADYLSQYQVQDRGLADLEQLNTHPEETQKRFAEFTPLKGDLRKQLSPLKGFIFKSKVQFHQALRETMEPDPNWRQRAVLRVTFQRPVVRQKDYFGFNEPYLLSPMLNVDQIQAIQLKLRIRYPF